MEAGYDYLLLRGRLRPKFLKFAGILVFIFGALLLASGGAYYGYATKARADLDNLNVTLPGAIADPGDALDPLNNLGNNLEPGDHLHPKDDPLSSLSSSAVPADAVVDYDGIVNEPENREAVGLAKVLPRLSALAISSRELYPGETLDANAWSNPWSYEPPEYRQRMLLQGFTPIGLSQAPPAGSLDSATRLIVPSIDVDSTIGELRILDLGDSRAYETPDKIVGHIPETANAGEVGSSWFFGHSESPTLGEGSVFLDLRKVPEKLRNGEDVFIIAENGDRQYLYRATSSQVVHQDDLRLYETGQATIHLVSCVPRLVYDHRLIVTGELIAEKIKS